MAYFHWIHSTRVNSCSEGRDVVLRLPRRQRWRPTAAARRDVETGEFASAAPTRAQACWICSWSPSSCAARKCYVAVTGTPVPRRDVGPWGPSGWRSSRRAWRAGRGRHMVRTERAPGARPGPAFETPCNAHPCSRGCQLRSQCHLCLKQKRKLGPPLRIPDCIEKCNLESVSFKKLTDIS